MAKIEPTPANDPFEGRQPTSHERTSGQTWDTSYTSAEGPAPWDIGQPQPAIVRLAARATLTGPILDAGCGLGENTLHLASLGLSVLGVDVAETALASAREQATKRGLAATFATADAFQLERLNQTFPTVVDSGLFHTFEPEEQLAYATNLALVTAPHGTLYVLCFGDGGPDQGPHPVTQQNLRIAFNPKTGWQILIIEPERIETIYHANGVAAWLATIERINPLT